MVCLGASLLLSACGGGGGGSPNDLVVTSTKLLPASQLANKCVTPDPLKEAKGTVDDEKAWVRSFVDERYLWYKDVPNLDPKNYASAELYFNDLKTPKLNSAGTPLDRYHWSETNAQAQAWQTGVYLDYGIEWQTIKSSPPRNWLVLNVEPLSPAGVAGVRRGDQLISVDGVDFVAGTDTNTINSGLNPGDSTAHTFVLRRAGTNVTISLSAGASYETTPVRNKQIFNYQGKKIAYLYFDSFIIKSQEPLVEAFQFFADQKVDELVLDMRYNGGGLLYQSAQLAYMVAGDKSLGKLYTQNIYNDKRQSETDDSKVEFVHQQIDWAQLTYTSQLPTLNLNRVTMLVSYNTASASEALVNGLRGIDVEVNLIGKNTYGKPYGFVPTSNCGRTYYAVEFRGANAKGFSDFDGGFAPTCVASDDLTHALGDPAETMLASAIYYVNNRKCSVSAASRLAAIQAPEPTNSLPRPRMVLTPMRRP